ncbi:unnamed protein product [Ilex paraguariensis]|uniref:Uncharacterized protein n=1 Tax=Ilex paraguariensis TaxID=185542 RepID=A0ABC8S9T9_9AQUA
MGDFMPILKWVGFNGIEKKLAVLQEKRNQFMQDLIEEHRRMRSNSSSEKETKTMIDVLLSFQESEPEYCKDEINKGMMLSQSVVFFHSDTSPFLFICQMEPSNKLISSQACFYMPRLPNCSVSST